MKFLMHRKILVAPLSILLSSSALVSVAGFRIETTKQYSVTFEPVRQKYSNRDSISFQWLSDGPPGKEIATYRWRTFDSVGRNPGFRKFTRHDGKSSGYARLLQLKDDLVQLENQSGKTGSIPLKSFSTRDQAWIKNEVNRRRMLANGNLSMGGQEIDLDIEIDTSEKQRVNELFGLPKKWLEYTVEIPSDAFSWQEEAIKEKAEIEFAKKLSKRVTNRGVSLRGEKFSVDYVWAVEVNAEAMRPIAKQFQKLARQKGYETSRELLELLVSFVQSMEHFLPPEQYHSSIHGQVSTLGLWMPLEALSQGKGDCDTKCVLLASILANFPNQSVIFLVGDQHAYVGIRGVPRKNESYRSIQGAKYVLVELTDRWGIGEIPERPGSRYRKEKFRVLKVYPVVDIDKTAEKTSEGIDNMRDSLEELLNAFD